MAHELVLADFNRRHLKMGLPAALFSIDRSKLTSKIRFLLAITTTVNLKGSFSKYFVVFAENPQLQQAFLLVINLLEHDKSEHKRDAKLKLKQMCFKIQKKYSRIRFCSIGSIQWQFIGGGCLLLP